MSTHGARSDWQRGDASVEDFLAGRYSRRHQLRFDGGAELAASSSPHNVRLPWSDPGAVDPEEAFVASLSSCHLLWFLSIAAREGYVVDRYEDDASGVLASDGKGRMSMTVVTLRPQVQWTAGRRPDDAALRRLHERAHDECFIANSVKTEVRCEPRP